MSKSPLALALCCALLAAPFAHALGASQSISQSPLPSDPSPNDPTPNDPTPNDPTPNDPTPRGGNGDGKEEDKKAKKPTWPRLKHVRKSITKDKMRLLTAKDVDKRAAARQTILSYGPAVCPTLMAGLNDKQSPEMQSALAALLDQLTLPAHAPLVAEAYKPKNVALSRWVVKRLSSFQNKECAKLFQKAAKHQDKGIAETAQFALASLGNLESLPFLLKMAREQWTERNVEIRSALPALKGRAATKELATLLATSKDSKDKIACLRLLSGAGTKEAVPAVASMLNSNQHQVRVATINALRGIVDGERPYANLTVFNAINEVKKWKARLGR